MVDLNEMASSRQIMVTSRKGQIFVMFYEVTVRGASGDEAEIQNYMFTQVHVLDGHKTEVPRFT